MSTMTTVQLSELYELDETAWLDKMAKLAAEGRCSDLDLANLQDYLESMARSERREVKSRLTTLLAHLLKWQFQPNHRSGSWKSTIFEQRRQLQDWLESATLRNHAAAVFEKAYQDARKQAAVDTGFTLAVFPEVSDWTIDSVLANEDIA
jgi:hypothetical protein